MEIKYTIQKEEVVEIAVDQIKWHHQTYDSKEEAINDHIRKCKHRVHMAEYTYRKAQAELAKAEAMQYKDKYIPATTEQSTQSTQTQPLSKSPLDDVKTLGRSNSK